MRYLEKRLEVDDPSRVLRLRDFTYAARCIAGGAPQRKGPSLAWPELVSGVGAAAP